MSCCPRRSLCFWGQQEMPPWTSVTFNKTSITLARSSDTCDSRGLFRLPHAQADLEQRRCWWPAGTWVLAQSGLACAVPAENNRVRHVAQEEAPRARSPSGHCLESCDSSPLPGETGEQSGLHAHCSVTKYEVFRAAMPSRHLYVCSRLLTLTSQAREVTLNRPGRGACVPSCRALVKDGDRETRQLLGIKPRSKLGRPRVTQGDMLPWDCRGGWARPTGQGSPAEPAGSGRASVLFGLHPCTVMADATSSCLPALSPALPAGAAWGRL